jgi:transcriptional regulator with XRE-family HTH domain
MPVIRNYHFNRGALRRLRKKHHYTQSEAAARCGISLTTYCQWETGRATPQPEALPRIAAALDTSPDTLINLPRQNWTLIHARAYRGHTINSLADSAGLDRMYLQRIETGTIAPTASDADRLAAALDMTAEEITRMYANYFDV